MSIHQGELAKDTNGKASQIATLKYWRHKRFAVTAGAWVLLDLNEFAPFTSILMQNTGASDLVLCYSNSTNVSVASNVPADAGYGIELKAGTEKPWMFSENVLIYARVKTGGADCKLTVAVGW